MPRGHYKRKPKAEQPTHKRKYTRRNVEKVQPKLPQFLLDHLIEKRAKVLVELAEMNQLLQENGITSTNIP